MTKKAKLFPDFLREARRKINWTEKDPLLLKKTLELSFWIYICSNVRSGGLGNVTLGHLRNRIYICIHSVKENTH